MSVNAGPSYTHGEWDKEQERYEDGCKSGTPEHLPATGGLIPADAPKRLVGDNTYVVPSATRKGSGMPS